MFSLKTKWTSVITTTALLSGAFVGISALPAEAACNGSNSREVVATDPMNGGETDEVKIDSCKTQDLIEAYGNVKDATGLAGLLGAGWWPAGVTAGVFFGWAWANQSSLKNCAKDNKGVKFTEVNGIVTGCSAQ